MRFFGKAVLTFSMVTLLASPAWAQGRGGGGFGMFGGAMLTNKGVQKELKVDDAQAEKLDAFVKEFRAKHRPEFEKVRELPEDQRREKMRELGRSSNEEMLKDLKDVLKPEQVKRFVQIQLQQAGPGVFTRPHVQENLKLTDDQKSKLRAIDEELGQSMRGVSRESAGDRQGAMKKAADLRKQAKEKAMALLSDEQKSTWKELTGEPFEFKFERRPAN